MANEGSIDTYFLREKIKNGSQFALTTVDDGTLPQKGPFCYYYCSDCECLLFFVTFVIIVIVVVSVSVIVC